MSNSIESYLLLELLIIILSQTISAGCREAEMIGMKIHISPSVNGIVLEVSGFSDQLFQTYRCAIKTLLGTLRIHSESHFAQHRDKLEEYFRKRTQDPSSLNQDICRYLTDNHTYMPHELIQLLNTISTADVVAFKQRIFRRLHYTAFAFGNITKQDAIKLYEFTVDEMCASPLKERKFNDTLVFEPGIYQMHFVGGDPSEENISTVQLHLLGKTSLEGKILSMLLAFLLTEPANDYFCHKESIASRVHLRLWIHKYDGNIHRGLSLELISHKDSALVSDVISRMDLFWYYMAPRILAEMSSDAFRRSLDAIIHYMQMGVGTMQQAYEEALQTILLEDQVNFQQKQKSIEILKNATREKIIEFFVAQYMNSSEKTNFNIVVEPSPIVHEATSMDRDYIPELDQVEQDEQTLNEQNQIRAKLNITTALKRAGVRNSKALDRLKKCPSKNWEQDVLKKALDSVQLINDMGHFRLQAQLDHGSVV